MYLEERVEQLETLSVDQGRQLESIAKGLANLTLDVRAIRLDQNNGFKRIDEQFARVDERFAKIDERFAKIDERFAKIDERFAKIDEQLTDIKTTLQLVVKLLTER